MNKIEHCKLCDNQSFKSNRGIVCNLTNLKPEFHEKCDEIVLESELIKTLRELNINYEYFQSQNKIKIRSFLGYVLLILIIISGCLYYINRLDRMGFISSLPYVIIGSSIVFFSVILRNFRQYKSKLKLVEQEKKKVDKIIEKYNVTYVPKIEFQKYKNGIEEVDVEIFLYK